jgi:hypothetical protein
MNIRDLKLIELKEHEDVDDEDDVNVKKKWKRKKDTTTVPRVYMITTYYY